MGSYKNLRNATTIVQFNPNTRAKIKEQIDLFSSLNIYICESKIQNVMETALEQNCDLLDGIFLLQERDSCFSCIESGNRDVVLFTDISNCNVPPEIVL